MTGKWIEKNHTIDERAFLEKLGLAKNGALRIEDIKMWTQGTSMGSPEKFGHTIVVTVLYSRTLEELEKETQNLNAKLKEIKNIVSKNEEVK